MRKRKHKSSRKIDNKLRFSVFDETTHEELFSFTGHGILILVTAILSVILLIIVVIMLISYTPLKNLIPGYPNSETRREMIQNTLRLDSLQKEAELWKFEMTNIQRIATGKDPLPPDSLGRKISGSVAEKKEKSASEDIKSDSLLRETVLNEDKAGIKDKPQKIERLEGLHFFPPVSGVVTQPYDEGLNHPFMDIAAKENSIVSSVLDGTVISADWNDETGYVISIQHKNNLITIYKHNAKLLKKVGDKISAGDPIALVGGTGKLSTACHLHFEMWHDGKPVDPSKYIRF
ncbi:MAG: M23 family metallopeptidase [Bacteroidales bacterium]|jgi:hypothetical protein|nr:M23 family metallopeptidase [Bacteroidales bacterium]